MTLGGQGHLFLGEQKEKKSCLVNGATSRSSQSSGEESIISTNFGSFKVPLLAALLHLKIKYKNGCFY